MLQIQTNTKHTLKNVLSSRLHYKDVSRKYTTELRKHVMFTAYAASLSILS